MEHIHHNDHLFIVVSSPSGAGKSTICRRFLESDDKTRLSVSATTRNMRKGETDGKDYFFLDKEGFQKRLENGCFLEHAHIFGNMYGTPLEPVQKLRKEGFDVLFDVDWQGADQINKSAPGQVVRIFILPPSFAELERRLRGRGTEKDEDVVRRLARARSEIEHGVFYDYIIVNGDLEKAVAELKEAVAIERNKLQKRRAGQNYATLFLAQ